MERVILHCDMNNFYASVECMLDPSLKGRPVAVCGSADDRHGIVLAKNYEAKAFDIKTGEAIWQAKEKCHSLITIQPHYEQYLKFSNLSKEIYSRYTDLIEPYGMDESWLDVTASSRFGSGRQIADIIRNTIKFELGLTISVGVSYNKIFAKLGSDMKKPDAVTEIPYSAFRSIVWPLPASELLGVGRSTARKLAGYGVLTIGDLAQMPDEVLSYKLGKNGLVLKRFANGLDTSPVLPLGYGLPIKSIGHGTTAVYDLTDPFQVWQVMLELSQDIGTRLKKHGKRASGIAIGIRDNDLKTREWQTPLDLPTQSAAEIAKSAFELFLLRYPWEKPIRSVTVRAINLLPDNEPLQYGLFTDTLDIEKREKLDNTIENIRMRFGKNSVRNAVLLGAKMLPGEKGIDLIMPTGIVS